MGPSWWTTTCFFPPRAYHPAHATAVAGLSAIKGGDNRYYNNLFVGTGGSAGEVAKNDNRHRRVTGYGLWVYDTRAYPLQTGGNISYHHAQAYAGETNHLVLAELDPKVKLVEQGGQFVLHLTPGLELKQARTTFVTTKLLGQARIPGLPYEDADGSSLKISTDYFGKKRSQAKPTPGPFENPGTGPLAPKVWYLRETLSP
jgi:alpha-N-arabinofuranosidase